MPLRDWLAALIVITVWGANFVITKVALTEMPPLLLGGLRFALVAFPAVLFIKRPSLPILTIVLYGATISLGQFASLFVAIDLGMPAGLASLVLQAQAFFTVIAGALILREPVRLHNALGLVIGVMGLGVIHQTAVPGTVPFVGLALTLLAALFWAMGNIVVKTAGKTDMLSLVIWGALVPPIPFFMLSWFFEGSEAIQHSFQNMSFVGISALFYQAFVATIVGYVLWGVLLNRHTVGKVAPLSLMVPIVGLISAAVFLDEHLVFLQWVGGAIVLIGLAINIFGLKLRQRLHVLRSAKR